VFPAIERRIDFAKADIMQLANLCHDCRDCYTACMYAPPHEFAVNIPALMSEIRLGVYNEYASPATLGTTFKHQKVTIGATATASVLFVLVIVTLINGTHHLVSLQHGPGAFYQIVPYLAMFVPAMVISLYAVIVLARGLLRYWRDIHSGRAPDHGELLLAGREALTLRWLRGGGAGCDYPTAKSSYSRWICHSFVFYGFACTFVATVLAAFYQDILGMLPPYPVLSLPVLFGIVGGIGLIVGATGLIYLKMASDKEPSYHKMTVADYGFLALLDLVAVTGMLTLVLRDTRAMGVVLAVHLGTVLGLLLTAPYGKFVHGFYRYASLVRNRIELGPDVGGDGGAADK
jgi:citrate/tricarballylate utilization protein